MLNKIDYNLDEDIIEEIKEISRKHHNIKKVVLFGSRARKDNSPRSDIDLAIYSAVDYSDLLDFIEDIENNTTTLLEFDFSNMNSIKYELFIEQVNKEGIVIYEKH
ncbi:nucleotidyltransferase domain-containing protein [Clostridium sp. D46t1_190503_E9]|uniref:nucleotidyltransferase domain-containing protein n=1 Tax=Clostridium sp. D46t1_190503_E9 TaxID=2787137 RepID=UPI0018995095|nr:nucleotidyltransferase domain-containing protein [Clostridium sp. D46t1_190503_E9]